MSNVLDKEKHSPDSGSQASAEPSPYRTINGTLLESVPLGVTTSTSPVVASAGTVVVTSELDTTVKPAAVPLNVTPVAPVRLAPRMLPAAPTTVERSLTRPRRCVNCIRDDCNMQSVANCHEGVKVVRPIGHK
jgi:hypothetical protein